MTPSSGKPWLMGLLDATNCRLGQVSDGMRRPGMASGEGAGGPSQKAMPPAAANCSSACAAAAEFDPLAVMIDRWRDARGFWDLAQAGYDPKSRYGNPAASNAIMAVIAANDAICLHLVRTQPKGESHIQAAASLKEACRGKVWEKEASERSRQLLELLRHKNEAQYLGKPLSSERISKIMRQAERFVEWAASILPADRTAGRGRGT